MKRLIRTAMAALLATVLLLPVFTVQASAATKWNGTSSLKTGKSYIISTAVTMDSKFTVPEDTKLTISKTGSLTVSKGVTATVKGTLSISKGGTLKVNGTLNSSEDSTIKVSGKLTYGSSAKMKLNGKVDITSTGTFSGSGAAEINLSAKSQYSSDIDKINNYLEKKNYSKACSLLENAISAYPDKAKSLRKVYSSAVIDWADELADEKDYAKACSILNSAKKHLTDTTDVQNRYDFYQGYIPVALTELTNYGGTDFNIGTNTDSFGNVHYNSFTNGGRDYKLKYILDGKYTNFSAILSCVSWYDGSNDCYVEIFVDGRSVLISDPVFSTTKPFEINVDITGAYELEIHAYNDWYLNYGLILSDAVVYKE